MAKEEKKENTQSEKPETPKPTPTEVKLPPTPPEKPMRTILIESFNPEEKSKSKKSDKSNE